MSDLSKRANLQGITEVRGMVRTTADPSFTPTQVVESEWVPLVRAGVESEDSEFWRFHGEASIVEHAYTVRDAFGEFEETIADGAFSRTLSRGPAVMFNFMHEPIYTMVTTNSGALTLAANPHLEARALVPKSDPAGQWAMPKVQRGDASSMSFAFRVTGQEWNDDYTVRRITEVNLDRGDVAVIVTGLGANPAAWGTVRAATLNPGEFVIPLAVLDEIREEPEGPDFASLRHDEMRALMARVRPPVL